jgi:hypothetical protein
VGDAERLAAEQDAVTWAAVAASVKHVYAGYIGRMGSKATKPRTDPKDPNKLVNRPHHHQPVWREAIVAEARRADYRTILVHGEATGLYPVAAIGTDEYWYLSSSPDPASVAPQVDTGKLGQLRAKGSPLVLTDEHRDRLGAGEPIHKLFGYGRAD